jgi:hypothetical protein
MPPEQEERVRTTRTRTARSDFEMSDVMGGVVVRIPAG